ncbi:MAG: type II secretion system protein GspN [Thermodesulfobacteriota bacterium]
MKLNMNRALAGYILAGIAMLILLLYLRFPGEALKDYVKATTAALYPRLLLSIDTVGPSVPPGLTLSNVTAAFRGSPDATLHADRLSVRPGALSLLKGRLSLLMAAEGYGGEIRGRVDFSRPFSVQGPLSAEAKIREIRIEKCAWLRQTLARQITGKLEGAVAYSSTAEAQKNEAGSIDFTLTNGTYQLLEAILGFDRLDFSRVEGKISFRNGALKITRLALTGEKLRCSLKGNILLADDIGESRIDLDGTLEIPGQGNKRVTLAISGTFGNPKMRFM